MKGDSSSEPAAAWETQARVLSMGPATPRLTHLDLATQGAPSSFRPFQYFLVGADSNSWHPAAACGFPRADHLEVVIPTDTAGWLSGRQDLLLRGPCGNGIDMAALYGRDLLVVTEGPALAPVRALLQGMDRERTRFGRITVLAGAVTPADLPCHGRLDLPGLRARLDLRLTVERPDATWDGERGVVSSLFRGLDVDPLATVVVVAGPRPLFKFAVLEALVRGVAENAILVLPERGHRCAPRSCGHCASGSLFTCAEGPVFPYPLLKEVPQQPF